MLRTGLEVTYEGVTYTVPLSEDPLSVGRAPTNGLSLTDASVSWNHASVWNAGDEVWIRDLNSTNGVFIDGQRVRGDALFPYGATVLLGEHVSLRLTRTSSGEDAHLVLEDPVRGRRFAVSEGRTSLAELGFGREATLVVDARSQVRLEVDGQPAGTVEVPLVMMIK
jgi:pSer/pThr/pTyr-binding forkhead associated (FHA) protein